MAPVVAFAESDQPAEAAAPTEAAKVSEPGAGPKPEVAESAVVSVEAGRQLYNVTCIACHQPGGAGKVGFAPFIRNRDFLALASDDFLRTSIVGGRPGTAMVPWGHLKPHQIDSLVAYLRSSHDANASNLEQADPERKIPGDAGKGGPLYAVYCASCHGQNATGYAEGGAGPAIGNAGFLAVASDDFIFQTVKHGRAGTSMRGFVGSTGLANLSEEQVGDIIAYLRDHEPAAPVVADRPGDPKAGHLHYNANCAAWVPSNETACPAQTTKKGFRGGSPGPVSVRFILRSPDAISLDNTRICDLL